MAESRTEQLVREAVGVFPDMEELEAAIDELQGAGFDRAHISLLADSATVEKKLGRYYRKTEDMAEHPKAPRIAYVGREEVGLAEGALIGGPLYVAAVVAGGAALAAGGPVGAAIAAAVAGGGVGAFAGAGLARFVGRNHAERIQEQLDAGGIVLWVNAPDAKAERRAVEILERHGGKNVHTHDVPIEE